MTLSGIQNYQRGNRGIWVNQGESHGGEVGVEGLRETSICLIQSEFLKVCIFLEVSSTLPFPYFTSFPFTTDLVWISILV